VLGRVLAPYGVNGWIKARAFTVSPDSLMAYRSWWLAENESDDGGWRELPVLETRKHADSVLARLDGLNRREDASAWRGASIGVPRSMLPVPAADEVYLVDLIGLTVVNRDGETLGRVAGLMETGAHAVLRVEGAARSERLIPLVSAYVDAIEMAAGRIVVDWQTDY
jgi:16S rRNA processing protein RimM